MCGGAASASTRVWESLVATTPLSKSYELAESNPDT